MNRNRFASLLCAIGLMAACEIRAQIDLGTFNVIASGDVAFVAAGNTHFHGGVLANQVLAFGGGVREFGMDAAGANTSTALVAVSTFFQVPASTVDLHNQSYYTAGNTISGTAQNVGTKLTTNPLLPGSLASVAADFATKSTNFNALANTASAVFSGNNLTLTAGGAGITAVDISLASLSSFFSSAGANSQIFYNGVTSTNRLVINVLGTSFGADSLNFYSKFVGVNSDSYSNVLWNFVSIENITTLGDRFAGSILAPNARITWTAQDLDGQMITKDLLVNGSQEFHNYFFFGSEPIPEPSTFGMIGAAFLAAMAGLRRSRKSRES